LTKRFRNSLVDVTRNVDAITRRGQPSQGSLLMAVATG
jgi:hypothetical protein